MPSLYSLSQEQSRLYDLLTKSIDEETGEVDSELMQLFQVNREELEQKCIQYGIVLKQLVADASMIKEEEKNLYERRKRIENNSERLKLILEDTLIKFGINQLSDAKIEIKFRKSEKINILDPELIPAEYKKIKTEVVEDKTLIKNAIKSGVEVKGAELITTQNIQIK